MTEPESDWKEKLRERTTTTRKLPEFCEPLKESGQITPHPVPQGIVGDIGAKISDARTSARKLENQRKRRQRNHRIDYYVSDEALDIIDSRTFPNPGGDRSSIINKLVLAGGKEASGILPASARARADASDSEE